MSWPPAARGSAHRKKIGIRAHFERPARVPMWIAGISICLLLASGIVAIVRSIPDSYASIPDEGAPSKHEGVSSGSEDADAKNPQAHLAVARATINRRNRAWCPECGVVESIRQVGRSGDFGGQDTVDVEIAGGVSGGASGSPIAANAATRKDYEITIRFRDGSTTVFKEATPRTWRLGSRVIVIGGANVLNN